MKYTINKTETVCPCCGNKIQKDELRPELNAELLISYPTKIGPWRNKSINLLLCMQCGCVVFPKEERDEIKAELRRS